MAVNPTALKGLFSKLKPVAKTVANYGDDAAKALTTYGDDAARMAFANADDLAVAAAQSDDIAKLISDADEPTGVWKRQWLNDDFADTTSPYYMPADIQNRPTALDVLADRVDYPYANEMLADEWKSPTTDMQQNATGDWFEVPLYSRKELEGLANEHIERVYNSQTYPLGASNAAGPTDELIAHLNNADVEFDSLRQLDPDAYKSGRSWEPEELVIAPEMFGGYDNRLVGSFSYPDGFTHPESAAMYYDSLERGAIPVEYLDAGYAIHMNQARADASKRMQGLPDLYDELRAELGPDAFSNDRKSDALKKIHPRTFHRMRVRRP